MVFPELLGFHGLAVLLLTVVALYLFSREDIPLETSSLIVLLLLMLGFEFFPYTVGDKTLRAVDFFNGFGHEALVAVCCLMIAGQGLVRTGALEPVGRMLSKLWRSFPLFSLLVTLVVAGILSAFINNTPIVVLLLPILISVSLRTNTSCNGILMPMGFATLLGGAATTVGTSTNLLVISIASDLGLRKIEMFDFALPAIMAASVGILYLWLIAPRFLPEREGLLFNNHSKVFSAHINVIEDSFADGATVSEVLNKTDNQIKIRKIQRGDVNVLPLPDSILRAGDRLDVQDTAERLKEFEHVLGGALYSGNTQVDEDHPLNADDQQLAELVVIRNSRLIDCTLREVAFKDRYQLITIALHRAGKEINTKKLGIGNVPLQLGDVLLVQGSRDNLQRVRESQDFLLLDETADLPHTQKATTSLVILAGIIASAAFGILPIAISALCGVLLLLLTKCLSWREASQALNTQIIMIVVASLALGSALLSTGGAEYLAQVFVYAFQSLPPAAVLSGLMALLALLTNIVSNNAAAVIGTPIAISVANQLGVPAEPFVIAVLFGANMSYATPMAYSTNLLVMNAAGYKFSDFVRIGLPLVFIMWGSLSLILPFLYGISW